MNMRTNVRNFRETSGPDSPESWMISALLKTGEFLPSKHHLSVDDCETWQKLWTFCETYQLETGRAPTVGEVKTKFPDFELVDCESPEWAAKQLRRESEKRKMLFALRNSIAALHNDDVELARTELAPIYASKPLDKPGVSVWDEHFFDESNDKWPVPYPALGRVTGGIGPGELWYIAAPSGHGKTMIACEYVAELLRTGMNIHYLSCEVPARTINKRTRRSLATAEELKLLDAKKDGKPDNDKIKSAINMQRGRIDGHLEVFDPSHGRITPATVRYHLDNADLVVVDHIGLMYTMDGRRAVDDWRALATISNSLLEEKLATNTPLLGLVQLNRDGDSSGNKPPKLTTIGGAYQLVQDADVIVTMKRLSDRVMVQGSEKNREGGTAVWYSNYDVPKANYAQIDYEKAQQIISDDEDLSHLQR